MAYDNIQDILKAFGDSRELKDLKFDESGRCCLSIGELYVNVESVDDNQSLLFFSFIGQIPDDNCEAFFQMLLSANCLFNETMGATLGVDPEENAVSLVYKEPAAFLDLQGFERVLEGFIHTMNFWRQKIRAFGSEEAVQVTSEMGLRV